MAASDVLHRRGPEGLDVSEFDVVVIGSGGAGLAAALEARATGATVLLLEAGNRPGGSTALSSGVFYAGGTRQQRERGIADTAAAMFEYYMTFTQWTVEPFIARRYCENAAADLEWL